jgi:hypothetical protein
MSWIYVIAFLTACNLEHHLRLRLETPKGAQEVTMHLAAVMDLGAGMHTRPVQPTIPSKDLQH